MAMHADDGAYKKETEVDEKKLRFRRGEISTFLKNLRHRRVATDLIFQVILGIFIIIIIMPFFMILFYIAGIGWVDVFGSREGEGIAFFTTFPGPTFDGGVAHAIIGTSYLVGVAGSVGIPLSVFGAVYINEYTKPGIVRYSIEFAADVLAGIPSIVIGAFGFAFFVGILRIGIGLVAGALSLAVMMIPTVLRTTQEALRAVPMGLREASLALGATKWATTWKVTIRAAFPGIVTGVLLAIGRIMGETAPLIFTAGYSQVVPSELFGPGSWVAAMPFTIYEYMTNPRADIQIKSHSVALALMIMVLAIDVVANLISRKVTRRLV